MQDKTITNWRHYFPLILVGIISIFLLIELNQFLNAFLGAIIMYVLLRPLMVSLTESKKWNRGPAAVVLMFGSFIIILLPVLGFSYLFVSKMTLMFSESSFFLQTMNTFDQKFYALFGRELFSAENLVTIQEKATGYITQFLGETLSVLADIGIMYFILYYMLTNTGKLEKGINKYLPLDPNDILILGNELKAQTKSNAIGAPFLALTQGLVAWLGYVIFGIHDAFFWGMMTGFFSFIPIVGSALVWVPAAIYQFTFGATWQGIGIILYGGIIIALVDNVFLFLFQKRFANVHPVITVFGVIIGLQMFGVPGVIFGPLLLSWFIILIRIYKKDFPQSEAAEEIVKK